MRAFHVVAVVHWIGGVGPERTFSLVLRLHRVLLTLSAVTVVAAVLGAHGALPWQREVLRLRRRDVR